MKHFILMSGGRRDAFVCPSQSMAKITQSIWHCLWLLCVVLIVKTKLDVVAEQPRQMGGCLNWRGGHQRVIYCC